MRLTPSMLADAAAEVGNIARGVKPDQLDAPTPCSEWRVRALANHLLQVATALDLAGREATVPGDVWDRDLMSDDWPQRLDARAREAVDAWADPVAWERMVGMGSTEMPAAVAATMLASDLVIHGWDLARATGQEYRCLEETAEMTRSFTQEMGEQARGMGIYAEPVAVAEDAPALEAALGLSGRDPAWKP